MDRVAVATESFQFWKAAGLPFVSCCALLGNEEGETSFRLGAVGDHGEAFSILQWHWEPRGRRIHDGCGIDVRSCAHGDALRAALWEFQHVDTKSWSLLKHAATIEEAVNILVTRVENSRNQASDIAKRTAHAKDWADHFEAQG